MTKPIYTEKNIKLTQLLLFGVGTLNVINLTQDVNAGDFSIKRYSQSALFQSDWLIYELIIDRLNQDNNNPVVRLSWTDALSLLAKKDGTGARSGIENNLKKLSDTYFIGSKAGESFISGSLIEQFSLNEKGFISVIVRPDIALFWSFVQWTDFELRRTLASQSELALWIYMYFVFAKNTRSPALSCVNRLCQFRSYNEKTFIEKVISANSIIKNATGINLDIVINNNDEKIMYWDIKEQ